MVYILAVNPGMLAAAGMDSASVFTATAVSAAVATLFMALRQLSGGSGIRHGTQRLLRLFRMRSADGTGRYRSMENCPGCSIRRRYRLYSAFLCSFREKLVNDVPSNLKFGITAGIGLFITFIGLKGAGIVIDDASTLVNLGSFSSPQFVLAVIGLIIVAVLYHFNVKGQYPDRYSGHLDFGYDRRSHRLVCGRSGSRRIFAVP